MRNIFKIEAFQIVTSDSHPEGIRSDISGFPKYIDSRSHAAPDSNPNGSEETALIVAQAEYADAVKTLTVANNPNRVKWTVTLENADGRQLARKTVGAFPDMTPVPEPTPEPEPDDEPAPEPEGGVE